MPLSMPEFCVNPEPRTALVLLLDVSGSMSGKPINELNAGIGKFETELKSNNVAVNRVELAIVTFGGTVNVEQDFISPDQFNAPTLSTCGGTPMGEAIERGLGLLDKRCKLYRSQGIEYYRPWFWLITDGEPNDDWEQPAKRLRRRDANNKLSAFIVGVEGADMDTLAQIAPPNRPPVQLKDLSFEEMFVWLSVNVSRVASSQGTSQQVALDPVNGWATQTS